LISLRALLYARIDAARQKVGRVGTTGGTF
jgi:hypothetical protein